MGRPEAEINWPLLEQMAEAGSCGAEIAGHFGIHPNTIYKRIEDRYNCSFSEFIHEKRSKGKSLLRLQQYNKALGLTTNGDNTLLIWLGKVRLEQKEAEYQNQTTPQMVVNADLAAGASSLIPAKAISETDNSSTK